MAKNMNNGFLSPGNVIPFFLVTTLFFMWGIPNNLNGVLIKQFMKSMELSVFQAGFIQSAFYMGYFVFALPAALLMRRLNYKTGLVFGLFLYAAGCVLFWPAARIGNYAFFLFSLFIIASGLTFLETGANPFIARMGNPGNSEQRLNFSQAFNPIGSVTGVILGTLFIFSGIEPGEHEINAMKHAGNYEAFLQGETLRVVKPYLWLAIFAAAWALIIMKTKFPEVEADETGEVQKDGSFKRLLKYPRFRRGVFAQFLYVGAQVGTWSYFIPYVQDYTDQPEKIAGYLLTSTLVAFGVGRFLSAWIMRFYDPNKLMRLFSLVNIALVSVGVTFPGWTGMLALLLTSFFMSLMYPTIFATSIRGLGTDTKVGSSVLVMAIIGGAIYTPAMGYLAESFQSMAIAMALPLLAYLYIFYFADYCVGKG